MPTYDATRFDPPAPLATVTVPDRRRKPRNPGAQRDQLGIVDHGRSPIDLARDQVMRPERERLAAPTP